MQVEEEKKYPSPEQPKFASPTITLEKTIPIQEFLQKKRKPPHLKSPRDHIYIFRIDCGGLNWHITKRYKEIERVLRHLSGGRQNKPSGENPEEIGKNLASKLQQESANPSKVLREFCEVSELTYNVNVIQKFKEGGLRKYSNCRLCNFLQFMKKALRRWWYTWIIITRDFVAFLRSSEAKLIQDIILFDPWFKVKYGIKETGLERGIFIQNATQSALLEAESEIEQQLWIKELMDAFSKSEWNLKKIPRPLAGYFPTQGESYCRWLIDGKDYFEQLYNSLMEAKKEVFIADWWLRPKIYLRRPVALDKKNRNEESRLDLVLQKLANRGVKIYVVIYKEAPLTFPLNSSYTKSMLEKRSSFIKVMRHSPCSVSPWMRHEKLIIIDQYVAFVGGLDVAFGRMDTSFHSLADLPDEKGKVIFPGHDYTNNRIAGEDGKEDKEKSLIDRYSQPRMPWHDVMLMLKGRVVKDLIRHFVQCWNHIKQDIGSRGRFHAIKKKGRKEKIREMMMERKAVHREDFDLPIPLYKFNVKETEGFSECNCQVLRSVSKWSIGLPMRETSIHNGYVALIEYAKNYVYIENQYFISSDGTPNCPVKNQVANALFNRIKKAHTNQEKFRVFIVLPLYPGGQGDIKDNNESAALRSILRYEHMTIGPAENSLLGRLEKEGINPKDYLLVLGLRNHGIINEIPVTELLYVHSKVMIMDDKRAIIGSANINDRSLIGTEDSEVSVLVTDTEEDKSKGFARSLRIALMKEHLGCNNEEELQDPTSDELWNKFNTQAKKNTDLYREIFGCDPDDKVKNTKELLQLRENFNNRTPEENLKIYKELAGKIKGQIVEWPMHFMKEEGLALGWMNVEMLMPDFFFE
eukprot:TRINITY_DN121_c0_g2_i2.p1 TRINITY_DN121_c0_g2~~TRINITY_DN121_c0_g2_i2.p1  ORF type:complete len:916 (+),score=74.54 TRINITY_DN121_c0_g2_i2:160-2748(+)